MKHLLLTTIAAVVLVGCRPEPPKISIGDAAGNGNIEAVKQHIAAGTDVNASTRRNGVTAVKALSVAAASGHKEIIELLIANGADVNEKSLFSRTPLRGAAQKGHLEMMELLISKGADLNEDLLLHGVAESGQEKAVEFLISKGLNANVRDNSGATPLHWASIGDTTGKDTTQVVELLIGRGANVNAKDNIGYTPMDYTASTYRDWQRLPEKKVESKRKASLLSKHGGNYSSINFAVVAGDIEAVRKFLERGADVNRMLSSVAFNMHRQPPFGFAKELKHTEIMELLRKHGGKTRKELNTAARRVKN